MASSFDARFGAKPPSSPTAVDIDRSARSDFSTWYVSVPHRNASENDAAPTGMIMNSCRSTLLSACTPPFTTFIIGTGKTCADGPPT